MESKYRLTEKKFISKYLAQRFIGEEASEDECDKEAEFILEYITQSLLATATPEKLKEGIEAIFIKYRKELEKHPRIDFINFATQDTLTLLQRSTAQAVQEAVGETLEEKDNEISQLKGELNARYLKEKEEVWYWLGDSNDHLESLCGPILIQPEDMRQVVQEAVEKELEKLLKVEIIVESPSEHHTREIKQAVQEAVKKERIEIGQYLKDNISEDLSWTKLISQLLKGQALKEEG